MDVRLAHRREPGDPVVQVLNPNGWASNEMPICVTNLAPGRPLPPVEEEACKPGNLTVGGYGSLACPAGQVVVDCDCEPGANGLVRACTPNTTTNTCDMTHYCLEGTCPDASVTPVCALP